MRACIARQVHKYKVCLLVLLSKAQPNLATEMTFRELLTLHEILKFDNSI